MINNTEKSTNLFVRPIDIIKGSRELLTDLLKQLCDLGYFINQYYEVLPHFAFDSIPLSEDIPLNSIEWGNLTFKLDALMFCDFLKDSGIVDQTYQSLWNHFSHDGKRFLKGANQLHHHGNKRYQRKTAYKNIRDGRLKCIAKSYFEKVEEISI